MDVFERFTDRARRVLVLAQEEARTMDHAFIGTEHILMGLIAEGDGVAAKALEALGISLERVQARVEEGSEDPGAAAAAIPSGSPPFTPRAKKALELGLREALQLGHSYIGTEHLLLGLVREGEGVAVQLLESLGADLVQVRATVIRFMAGYREPGAEGLARRSTATFRGPEAKLVSCSFCGRQPPESGRLVTGTDAFICEQCVRRWNRQLARADVSGSILRPGIGRLRQTVRPTAPQTPPDGASDGSSTSG
jgi:ATP-dependent Clp protease ATP-binding subunit ClpC